MKTSDEIEDMHKNLVCLVHGIESNKENVMGMKNTVGHLCQDELIMESVIKYQELLLKKFVSEINHKLTDLSRHKIV